MNTREQGIVVNPEEELRKLREKSGRNELDELKHGLLGGYRRNDVARYVARLKDQLQITERTYKNRIAELTAEKDQLRYERDALQDRLSRMDAEPPARTYGEYPFARGASAEPAADEAVVQPSVEQPGDSALQRERDALLGEKEALEAETRDLRARLESYEQAAVESEAALRGDLQASLGRMEAGQARLARVEADLAEAERKLESLASLQAEKEAAEAAAAQMRDSLNSLVVQAEGLVKENGAVRGMLESEREKARQYQAAAGRIADLMARLKAANQLLDERVAEMDRAFNGGSVPAGAPDASGPLKRAASAPDSAGPDDQLKEIVAELNAIKESLAEFQLPGRTSARGKKPNIRFSVEKLEVDCKPPKSGEYWDGLEDYQRPAAPDLNI